MLHGGKLIVGCVKPFQTPFAIL